jgi:hypothetical protein
VTECVQCQGRSSNAYLCARCCSELRSMLDGLAIGNPLGNGRRSRPWLVCLEDAALGGTRLGESARRSTERNSPTPFNERASDELGKVTNTLTTWCRHLAESRGIEVVL